VSRRARRERPATAAEQAAIERAAELAREAITAPAGQRRAAVDRLRRQVDQIRDPGNLANLSGAELLDAIRDRYPDCLHQPESLRTIGRIMERPEENETDTDHGCRR
jgi:hypothetical protein